MHGVVIASTWIAFLAMLASIILYAVAGSMMMKIAAPTDADKAKQRQLGMAAFWVLVVGAIFGLLAAITASCHPSAGIGKFLRGLRDQIGYRRLRGQEVYGPPAASAQEVL